MKTASGRFFTLTKLLRVNCIIALLLLSRTLPGQVVHGELIELPVFATEQNFEVVPAGNSGIFLYRYVSLSGLAQLQLVKVDTTLKQQWQGHLVVPANHELVAKQFSMGRLYLLLRPLDLRDKTLTMFSISEESGNFIRYNIKNFIAFNVLEFKIAHEAVLIGGYFNRVPVVVHYDLNSLQSKVLPGLFNEMGELNQIKVHDDGTFDILINSRNINRQRTLWLRTYSKECSLIRNVMVDTEEMKHLIFGQSVKTNDDTQMIAGVYGQRSSEFSRGIFIARIDLSGYQEIRYYPFAELKNFFRYMKARREQRVKARIERRKVKGKMMRLNYRFLVHEIVPYKDQFVLLGEAFYPRYTNVQRSSNFFSSMGGVGGMIQNGRIFDGYYYTHAVVLGFDRVGKIKWDNSFEINDVKTFTLEQFVRMEPKGDQIVLLYSFENKLRSKVIQGEKVIEGKMIDEPATELSEKKNIAKSGTSKLEYWYGNYFYTYGVHPFSRRGRGLPQETFYLRKIGVK